MVKLIVLLVLAICIYPIFGDFPCMATKDGNPDERWVFDADKFDVVLVTPPQPVKWRGHDINLGFVFEFCTQSGAVLSNPEKNNNSATWLGWDFGAMTKFVYDKQTPISPVNLTPPTGKRDVEEKQEESSTEEVFAPEDVTAVRSFTQYYTGGDEGFPCKAYGRRATVHIYCTDSPAANCLMVPNSPSRFCLGNVTNPINNPCICNYEYNLDLDPCQLQLSLLVHNCPSMDHVPLGPAPVQGPPTEPASPIVPGSQNQGPNGGQVFGIILLVLVLIALAVFLGGFIYNVQVNNKRGVDAIPFIDVCRKDNNPYQPAPASGGYGSTA